MRRRPGILQCPPRRNPRRRLLAGWLPGLAALGVSLLACLPLSACQLADDGGGLASAVAVTLQPTMGAGPARQPSAGSSAAGTSAAGSSSGGASSAGPSMAGTTTADPGPAPAGAAAASTVVVLGDSISTGFQTSVEASWPNVLVQDFARTGVNITLLNGARNGAGYVEPGDGDLPFAAQAEADVVPQAAVVVVYGSENDVGQDVTQIGDQVRKTVAVIRDKAPAAQILLVGPAAVQDDPDEGLLAVRDAIASAADATGASFVDPIQLGWFTGQEATLIGPDGDHPSVLGHEYLAAQMEGLLRPLIPEAG